MLLLNVRYTIWIDDHMIYNEYNNKQQIKGEHSPVNVVLWCCFSLAIKRPIIFYYIIYKYNVKHY